MPPLSRLHFLSLSAAALLAACAGGNEPLSPLMDEGNPTTLAAGEGELVICKVANEPGTFYFSFSTVDPGGNPGPSGSNVAVNAGSCVVALSGLTGRHVATVTEGPLDAFWDLTSITVVPTIPVGLVPVVDIPNQSVSSIVLSNDVGAEVTFTNTYTPPPTGCTLTQGYWKTHSEKGPAPYDATWALLANGADTPFFLSGGTWYSVFWTAPAGNQYYNLAHQYMAAYLSILKGADGSAVAAAMASATTLFNTYTPAQIGALRATSALRQQFVALAGTLDAYNNGLTGPGHCED